MLRLTGSIEDQQNQRIFSNALEDTEFAKTNNKVDDFFRKKPAQSDA
jgi:hypothetical protein